MDSDDSSSIFLLAAVAAVGAVLYLFASLAEGAISSLSRARIERLAEQDPNTAGRLMHFAEHAPRHLAGAAVLRLAALSAAAVALVQILAGIGAGGGTLLDWLILFVGTLVVGWIIPRTFAATWPEEVVLTLWLPLRVLEWVCSPIASPVAFATSALARVLGAEAIPEGPVVTPAELKVLVAASEEEGLIEDQERAMIHNVLELERITVREVMVPRPDITALPATTTVREAIEILVREGYSRLPVFDETIDNVVGILYGKDLFRPLLDGLLDQPVRPIIRPAYFVPESKKTDDLLRELQQSRVQIAIVVDEYGGTAGLVTIEDLLEEIVGEIQDEFDAEEQKIVKDGDGEAVVDAAVSIDDVNEALALNLHADEVDTIGGLVYEQLGRVPVVGDRVNVDDALLTVIGATGRRVTRVRVTRLTDTSSNGATNSPRAVGEG